MPQVPVAPVAIVGLAALMPGARDTTEYWRNIVTGRDLITDVPPSHWSPDDFYDPDPATPDKTYCRRGAFLPDIDFDPLAHGLPPATLPALDPGQLLGLVVADELLADLDRGLASAPDRERTSVIIGSSTLSRVGTMDARSSGRSGGVPCANRGSTTRRRTRCATGSPRTTCRGRRPRSPACCPMSSPAGSPTGWTCTARTAPSTPRARVRWRRSRPASTNCRSAWPTWCSPAASTRPTTR